MAGIQSPFLSLWDIIHNYKFHVSLFFRLASYIFPRRRLNQLNTIYWILYTRRRRALLLLLTLGSLLLFYIFICIFAFPALERRSRGCILIFDFPLRTTNYEPLTAMAKYARTTNYELRTTNSKAASPFRFTGMSSSLLSKSTPPFNPWSPQGFLVSPLTRRR
jgi:hypothetical protein